MKFEYRARTESGKVRRGTVEARSQEAALSLLQELGLYVTDLKSAKAKPFYTKELKFLSRASPKDLVMFSRQLSIMFKSKVSLLEALRTLARQTDKADFKDKILKLAKKVEGGTSLSQALSMYPDLFDTFYINIVRAGEASGKLSESLSYLADHLERKYNLRSRIRGAMIYPALVIVMIVVVLAIMGLYVVPQMTKIMEQTGGELPTVTKFIIGGINFLKSWGWIIIAGLIGVAVLAYRYVKTKTGKKKFDRILLRLPLLGSLFKRLYLSRTAENLSTLISGGLPVVKALKITGDVVGNSKYRQAIDTTSEEVKKGRRISMVLKKYPEIFPPIFTTMVLVGEKTGTIDSTLMDISEFYREELNRSIERLLKILEPALILGLGAIVAGLVASILLPLYQTVSF